MSEHRTSRRLPHRAEHVGSFLRPARLVEAARRARSGALDAADFRALQDESIREIVAFQEGLGLGTVTDGEFRRRSWSAGFIDAVDGFGLREGTLGLMSAASSTSSSRSRGRSGVKPEPGGRPASRIRMR